MQFRTSTIGGTQGGYSFYTRRNPNLSEFLAFNIDVDGNSNFYGTLGVTSNITANSFIKSGGLSTQFLKADGSVDANTYLTTSLAASTYLPLTGGTISGSIRRQDNNYNNSPNTFYFNMLNYNARPNNNITNSPTAQLTFTDRPGTSGFPTAVRTSDIYLMTAKNWDGSNYGVYLDTTLSIVANQDGGRVGISKLNPSYKLDVNGTLGVSGTTTLFNTLTGTTGTFSTRLGVGSIENPSVTSLFTSGSGDQEIHFTHSDNIQGRKVSLRLTNNNSGFYTYGGLIYALQGEGLNQYNRMSLGVNTTEIILFC